MKSYNDKERVTTKGILASFILADIATVILSVFNKNLTTVMIAFNIFFFLSLLATMRFVRKGFRAFMVLLILLLFFGFALNWRIPKFTKPNNDNNNTTVVSDNNDDNSSKEDEEKNNDATNETKCENSTQSSTSKSTTAYGRRRVYRRNVAPSITPSYGNTGGSSAKGNPLTGAAKVYGPTEQNFVSKSTTTPVDPSITKNATKVSLKDGIDAYVKNNDKDSSKDQFVNKDADKGKVADDKWLEENLPKKEDGTQKSDENKSDDSKENDNKSEDKADNTQADNTQKSDDTKSDTNKEENNKSEENSDKPATEDTSKSDNTKSDTSKEDNNKSDVKPDTKPATDNTPKSDNTKSDTSKEDSNKSDVKTDTKPTTVNKPSVTPIDGNNANAGDSVQFRVNNAKSISGLEGLDYTNSNGVVTVQTKAGEATVISIVAHGEDGSTATASVSVNALY